VCYNVDLTIHLYHSAGFHRNIRQSSGNLLMYKLKRKLGDENTTLDSVGEIQAAADK